MNVFLYPDDVFVQAVMDELGLHARDRGLISAALARPAAVVYGEEAYPGVHAKAAALIDSISRSHPLLDGNKRLAFLLAARFYQLNGYRFTASPQETDRFMRECAAGLTLDETSGWLALNTTEVQRPSTPPATD